MAALRLAGCSAPAPDADHVVGPVTRQHSQQRFDDVTAGRNLQVAFGASCTQDCTGHRAGYLWAVEHGAHDSDCINASRSFEQGCKLAVLDQIVLSN